MGTPPVYRRARSLVCYWERSDFVVRNYRAGTITALDPLSALILHRFDGWKPLESVQEHLPGLSLRELRRISTILTERALLERSASRAPSDDDPMKTWDSWSPVASVFHFGTRNLPIRIDDVRSERRLKEKARTQPEPIKRYPGARTFALPPARRDGELAETLLRRRTWRRFSRGRLELEELATLLGLTWGVQKWTGTRHFRPMPFKTSPSGGGCHPLEAYVLALKVAGLPRGLYHYVADEHYLELLKERASPRQVERYIPGQPEYRSAAALFMMTAVFPRKQWKYPYPRAYRSILLEAGHFCQTFCLVATWLGLAPFETALLDETRLERDIQVDGITEGFLYAAGVGIRPEGVDRAFPGG